MGFNETSDLPRLSCNAWIRSEKNYIKKNLQEFHFNFVWLIKPLVLSAEFSAYKSAALTLQSKFLLGYVTGETATNLWVYFLCSLLLFMMFSGAWPHLQTRRNVFGTRERVRELLTFSCWKKMGNSEQRKNGNGSKPLFTPYTCISITHSFFCSHFSFLTVRSPFPFLPSLFLVLATSIGGL